MTSSDAVVKSVAKQLKYYFDVKRLEDGFDLSDSNAPILDHPPLKARPTLQYNGLHDRPLKHYFSQSEVRVQLTHMGKGETHLKNPREIRIKRSLTRTMKKHNFLRSTIPDCYYVHTSSGRKVHPSLVGFGASPKSMRQKSLKGGWPVLRCAPPVNITRGEAERLVNSASKLLLATETVEHLTKTQPSSTWARSRQSAPGSFEQAPAGGGKRRPLTAKYTWDINGHKVLTTQVKAYDDSYLDKVARRPLRHFPSPPSSSSGEESARSIHRPSPPLSRPSTPPPHEKHHSSTIHREKTVINLPEEQIREEVKVVKRKPEPAKNEMGIQTERHLLEEYDQVEDEVKDGPWAEYQIYVKTGDRVGASTSADVFLTIYGDKGRTPPLKLATSKHNKVKFQRAKEDLFILAAHHVGRMKKIKIGHDRPQLNYAWFLENVTIYDMNDKQIYDFPLAKWLSGQDDDRRTYRILPVDRIRSFVDALEKPQQSTKALKQLPSESSSGSSNHRKDQASMKPKRSQRSRSSSSSSSRSTSPVVIQDEKKTKPADKKEDLSDQPPPRTVIQFKKKGSQVVEEEVVLNETFLAGYRAGLQAGEATERKQKQDERSKERQLLTGPSIHEACRNGDLHRVMQLLEKLPEIKDLKDESGWIPLHIAAASGHVDIIKWLTSATRDDLDVETPTGYTATHIAAMNGHINALLVLNAMGAELGCKTVDEQTPLHLAARSGHLECVKWLVANGAELDTQDSFGRTPTELAEEYQHSTVMDFLRVCERDLSDPNSTFAQMHRAHQRGGSMNLPTIREDDKGSSGSEAVMVGSTSTVDDRRSKEKGQQLNEKQKVYEKQHHQMDEQGLSFLDSIRRESED